MKAILITRTDETSSVSTELREGEEAQHLLELITEAAKSCADDAKYVRGFVDDTDKGAVTAPGLTEHKADYHNQHACNFSNKADNLCANSKCSWE